MVYELRDDALCLIDRDGKAHAFDSFFCDLRTIDPDDLSISGDECPAGVARIDGCIGLNELETLVDIIEASVQCADDARSQSPFLRPVGHQSLPKKLRGDRHCLRS